MGGVRKAIISLMTLLSQSCPISIANESNLAFPISNTVKFVCVLCVILMKTI